MAIARKNWTPSKYSAVCSRHFRESDIIRTENIVLADGPVQNNIPLKYPKLKENAVPYIFPNLPSYLSKT
ncbi:unnamed protein product [Acanthoscelides obtectus]|uniref:THAP-type domain-containing protein n=1 Tax=Acanthoscelides obtectus TaxID=200917 RepID=A0A9P0MGT1_ACAOB|nr:unnamed protein product [Acanthoscelides obtectus]CAK1619993.1 hypothetical protein AOBTE_LOCUS118 [Acanthoscelides obtectus]